MNRDEKALLYDDLVREGDRVNRRLSQIKTNINRTTEEDAEVKTLNEKLGVLEVRMNKLFLEG